MNVSEKLGRLFRREASITSVRNVRSIEERRQERLGISSDELNAKFAAFTSEVEKRVSALESEVLGKERSTKERSAERSA